jgi:hypothetical protein
MILPSKEGVRVIERSQAQSVKPKMKERELRSGVNLQGALKTKVVKQSGVKQGLGIPSSHAFISSALIKKKRRIW